MTDQFQPKRFSRGVRLTVEHQYDPLTDVKNAAADANIQGIVEEMGQCQASWVIPWTGAAAVANDGVVAYLPWTMPPFQQDFARTTLAPPSYEVTLREISLSFDQRAEPLGVVGPQSTSAPGKLTDCDMSRYSMTLSLLERAPVPISQTLAYPLGDTLTTREVLKFEIDGVTAFGAGDDGLSIIGNNPALATDLNVVIKPFAVYVWKLECPGLYTSSGGTIDIWTCTVGGAFVPGDTARLTLNGTNYDYVVLAGDTAVNVALGVAYLASANPNYDIIADALSPTVEVRYNRALAGGAVVSGFLAGAGTFVAVHDQVGAPGTIEQLMLPSLNLSATFVSPLTSRDSTREIAYGPGIQNIPTAHEGDRNGQTIPLTVPAAGDTITGTDIQNANHAFDRALRNGAGSGYGVGFGALCDQTQASNALPAELLANDSHYSMIVVPMWCGQRHESLRFKNVIGAGLPYFTITAPSTTPDWKQPTEDRRVILVPEGFVLHHAFAVWSGYSPRTDNDLGELSNGRWPEDDDYRQIVSISLTSGLRSDDYLGQCVGLLTFTPAGGAFPFNNFLVDEFDPEQPGAGQISGYRLLQIPLVNDAGSYDTNSWYESGPPFFMGRANNVTSPRTDCGDLPTAFGGAAFATPVTLGRENMLELRWRKDNAVTGLTTDDTVGEEAVFVGQGGDWIILVGKQTVGG